MVEPSIRSDAEPTASAATAERQTQASATVQKPDVQSHNGHGPTGQDPHGQDPTDQEQRSAAQNADPSSPADGERVVLPVDVLNAAGGAAPPEPAEQALVRRRKQDIPKGVFVKCPACNEMNARRVLDANLWVCPACQHHMRLSGRQRIEQLCDEKAFEEFAGDLRPSDPLKFEDTKKYADRTAELIKSTGQNDSVIIGKGFVKGRPLIVAAMDPTFMMGSMGTVCGEKLTLAIEAAVEQDLPILIVTCSGGARMQEGALSLQQMAKTSAALARLDDAGGLCITLLTDPTTGGVSASFAMLGDVILAEPQALIGFAGQRVIAGTVRQALPPGFQRAEFLLKHGFIDRIVHRSNLRSEVARLIDYCGK